MSESLGKLSLPLLPAESEAPHDWHGWKAVLPVLPESALDAPEPVAPQGVYNETAAELPLELPAVAAVAPKQVELLAPAGGIEAAFAAFHFGADAIYLGLKKFSARAEAENFTLEELDEVTAYAHSLQPRRKAFVTVNTLIRQDELPELVEALAALADIGVDAVILQDLGIYHLARRHFPELELHASTQLAVHNRAGAAALQAMGFHRVVLARELTFEEVHDITATAGIETEVFIHGALCYSYSGLCLFSAQTLGRSGNRGKCAYSCRDSYEVAGAPLTLRDGSEVRRDPRQGFPFSMKDLALPDHIPALRAAGVSCFKIEGRKKSPLYVATTTDYYRRLMDGRMSEDERPIQEADLQTVFSRPWTRLFVQSHKDKEVADRDTVGHRGTHIGKVEAVHHPGTKEARLRFRTHRALERHDGLQIDLPTLGKPFGFSVEHLWIVGAGRKAKREEVFEAPAESLVEVSLPPDHPALPLGAPVYCSSSQEVKQRYRHERPKPGQHHTRKPLVVEIVLTKGELTAAGRVADLEIRQTLPGPFPPARDAQAMEDAVRSTFGRLGPTRFMLDSLTFRNEAMRFVPVSQLNQLRRDLVADLEAALRKQLAEKVQRIQAEVCPAEFLPSPPENRGRGAGSEGELRTEYRVSSTPSLPTPLPRLQGRGETVRLALSPVSGRGEKCPFRWSIKIDRIGFLDAFEEADLADVEEIIVDIARDHPSLLHDQLNNWADRVGRDRLRLSLPAVTRKWEEKGLLHKIQALRAAGWQRWEAANLSAWSYLGLDPRQSDTGSLDLSADWSLYVLNRMAVQQLRAMGVRRFALSPEDGVDNWRSLLSEFGQEAVLIVYQDTPLFLAESCAYANLIGGCPGKANCKFESMEMVSSHGEKVTALDYHCRTIVLNEGPYCLSARLKDLARAGAVHLRADFIYRPYEPMQVRDRWRLVRAGKSVPGGHCANYDRGIL